MSAFRVFVAAACFAVATQVAPVAHADGAPAPQFSSFVCANDALALTVWRDDRGSLLNALMERSDGFSHYLACFDAPAEDAPRFGDCHAVLLVDSYDATLLHDEKGASFARVTQAIGPIGGERTAPVDLPCSAHF
jgi:hypothetical protein